LQSSYLCFLHSWDVRCMSPHPEFLVRWMESCELFAWVGLKPWSSQSLTLESQGLQACLA
jgi:hypothetical protein